jgi:hypothetical protein
MVPASASKTSDRDDGSGTAATPAAVGAALGAAALDLGGCGNPCLARLGELVECPAVIGQDGGTIAENQAALERHMLDWCATSWSAEPAASEIREWVRPTFRILSGSLAAARAPNGIADGWSPENAEAVDE